MQLDLTIQSGSGSATAGTLHGLHLPLGMLMLLCSKMPSTVGIKQRGMQ